MLEFIDTVIIPFFLDIYDAIGYVGVAFAIGLETDLFDSASVDAAIAQVGERWGHLNSLVNAAGPMVGGLKSFETYTD